MAGGVQSTLYRISGAVCKAPSDGATALPRSRAGVEDRESLVSVGGVLHLHLSRCMPRLPRQNAVRNREGIQVSRSIRVYESDAAQGVIIQEPLSTAAAVRIMQMENVDAGAAEWCEAVSVQRVAKGLAQRDTDRSPDRPNPVLLFNTLHRSSRKETVLSDISPMDSRLVLYDTLVHICTCVTTVNS